jgi:hypothetical protein
MSKRKKRKASLISSDRLERARARRERKAPAKAKAAAAAEVERQRTASMAAAEQLWLDGCPPFSGVPIHQWADFAAWKRLESLPLTDLYVYDPSAVYECQNRYCSPTYGEPWRGSLLQLYHRGRDLLCPRCLSPYDEPILLEAITTPVDDSVADETWG